MSRLSTLLRQPEYIHVVLNHFPLVGLLVAVLALAAALVLRNRPAVIIGLTLVGLLSLSAWPVAHYGQEGYDRVLAMTDDAGGRFLQYHKELADRWIFLYYLTAGAACASLVAAWKWPGALIPMAILCGVLACASLTAGVFIAHAGAEVRHREFRGAPPPPSQSESADRQSARAREVAVGHGRANRGAGHWIRSATGCPPWRQRQNRSQSGRRFCASRA
jgi:hypothetical protein